MTHDAAVLKARKVASDVLAPSAGQNDKAGQFSTEAVKSLGESGLLGLMLPADVGGSGLGPRTLAAVIATLAEADASVAMGYLMHILGTLRSQRGVQVRFRRSRPYCGRSVQAATYPPLLSVNPARVVISGLRFHAHIVTVTGCSLAPRSRG